MSTRAVTTTQGTDRIAVLVAAARQSGSQMLRVWVRSGVAWGVFASVVVSLWVLFANGGLAYYLTPLTVRGYAPAHGLLRPSAPVGQMLGVVGTLLMLVPFLYMGIKRSRAAGRGVMRVFLEVHLFCGILGPVLVTYHTAFKFNGFVAAAYWAMAVVMLSGFVGRYLYVRIPRSIRGTELTRADLDARADRLHVELLATAGGGSIVEQIGQLERIAAPPEDRLSWAGLLFGEFIVRRRLAALHRDIRSSGLAEPQQDALATVAVERVMLLRRAAYLRRTKSAFGLWHVFHLPLVYLMLAIVVIHVAVVMYMGYVPFPW